MSDKAFGMTIWGILIAIMITIAIVIFVFSYFANTYAYTMPWDGTYETQYSWGTGCRVKINDKFMPESSVRAVQ